MKITVAFFWIYCFGFINSGSVASAQKASDSIRPFQLGIIDELYSGILKENRILNIYLPQGYSRNDSIHYPVIYLLDGSADEDFIHVAGLLQFNNFEWINEVPKSILVGIANVNRQLDFTFPTSIKEDKKQWPLTGGSADFISFIENELQPFIKNKYKANSDRTIIGQSLGGLLATEILIHKMELFNRYIIISPSLWWNNGSLLDNCFKVCDSKPNHQVKVYIGVGKEGLTPGNSIRIMEDDAKTLYQKISDCKNNSLSVWFDFLPNETHATISHIAIFNAMRLIYK